MINKTLNFEYKRNLWETNLKKLIKFVSQKDRLPEPLEMYDGINIGMWLNIQRNRYNSGKLSELEIELLDNVYENWNGNGEERAMVDVNLELMKDWKLLVPRGELPIDELYSEEDLLKCVQNKCYSLQMLANYYFAMKERKQPIDMTWLNELSYFNIWDVLSIIYPCIDSKYIKLIRDITLSSLHWEKVKNINDFENLVYLFPYNSSSEMQHGVDTLMERTLTEDEINIIRSIYIDNTLSISSLPPHQIAHILSKLSNNADEYLYKTNTFLDTVFEEDKFKLPLSVKSYLYRSGFITREDVLRNSFEKICNNPTIESVSMYFLYLLEKNEKTKVIEESYETLNADDPMNDAFEMPYIPNITKKINNSLFWYFGKDNITIRDVYELFKYPYNVWNLGRIGRKSIEVLYEEMNKILSSKGLPLLESKCLEYKK